jgi:hypothetical protein
VDECLVYFRQAVHSPATVPPWSAWWAENAEIARQVFPPLEFARLKHRRLRGAREILQNRGELSEDWVPPNPLLHGSCSECGERVTNQSGGPGGGYLTCPNCGLVGVYDSR